MTDITFGNKWWYSRPLAILWAWTFGLLYALVFVPLALIYALIGSILRGLGVGTQSDIPLSTPIKNQASWWLALHNHALTGSGPISPIPPLLDPDAY